MTMTISAKRTLRVITRALVAFALGVGTMLPAGLAMPQAAEAASTKVAVDRSEDYNDTFTGTAATGRWTATRRSA